MENANEIDFEFIKSPACQNYKTTGYVPSADSGVTICAGFDLTTQSLSEMRKYKMSQKVIEKLQPYIGLKGTTAKQFLLKHPLNVSQNEAKEINSFMINKYVFRASHICSKNGIDYKSLPKSVKTILFSRVIHSWNLKTEVIECLKKKNYDQLGQQLQKMKGYGARGKNEAAYLKNNLKIELAFEDYFEQVILSKKEISRRIVNVSTAGNTQTTTYQITYEIKKQRRLKQSAKKKFGYLLNLMKLGNELK